MGHRERVSTGEPRFGAKGTHVIQAVAWIDGRLGAGSFRKLAERAGADWSSPMPMIWYDLDVLLEVISEAALKLDMTIEDVTTQIALRNAQNDLTTIYRVFLRLLRPTVVLGFMPRMWETYFRFGTVKVLQNEPGSFTLITHGIPQRFLGWLRGGWKGFLPETIRVAGGNSVAIEVGTPERDQAPDTFAVIVKATYRMR